jgi:flagellar biosynthesis regulator FlbT
MQASPGIVFQPEGVLTQQSLVFFVQAMLVEAVMKPQAMRTFRRYVSGMSYLCKQFRVIKY